MIIAVKSTSRVLTTYEPVRKENSLVGDATISKGIDIRISGHVSVCGSAAGIEATALSWAAASKYHIVLFRQIERCG